MSETDRPKKSTGPGIKLLIAMMLLAIGSWWALTQPPKPAPMQRASFLDWFRSPVEQNAFRRLPSAGNDINHIFVVPGSELLWAVGDRGLIVHSADGGQSWTPQTSGTENHLRSVTFFNATTGWAVGSRGTLLSTGDGGLSWTPQTSGTENDLSSVTFLNATTGWAVGGGGTILSTGDGGKTWTPLKYRRYPAPWYWLLCIAILGLTISAFRQSDTSSDKSETVTDLLASDRPLRPDDPDPLRFNEISAGLSRFMRNPRTEPPLTIAVTGEWGTGKSSLMNLLHQDLKTKGFSMVWFNAWHHQKGEQLLASIFANIRSQGVPGLLQFSGGRPVGFLYRLRLLKRRGTRHWLLLIILVLLFSATLAWLFKDLDNIKDVEDAVQNLLAADRTRLLIALGGTLAPVLALFKTLQGFALSPLKLIASGSGRRPQGHANRPRRPLPFCARIRRCDRVAGSWTYDSVYRRPGPLQ